MNYTNTVKQISQLVTAKINLSPAYQRNLVWSLPQKQDLINSIQNNLPIGVICLTDSDKPEAVDGKQRITAIIEFFKGEFKVNNVTYDNMSEIDKQQFVDYSVPTMLIDGDAEFIHKAFVKLQAGSRLNPTEVRRASNSKVQQLVALVAKHSIWPQIGITKGMMNRLKHLNIIEQALCIQLVGAATGVAKGDIDKMYIACESDDFKVKATAKQMNEVLTQIETAFEHRLDCLNAINMPFTMFTFNNISDDRHAVMAEFLGDFEDGLKDVKKTKKPDNMQRKYIKTLSGAGSKKRMVERFGVMKKLMVAEGVL